MSNPIEEFGRMITDHMKECTKANKGHFLELGRIEKGLALTVSSLRDSIPQGDYMVSWHIRPGAERPITQGDRVLVAWIEEEPVVIEILVSS